MGTALHEVERDRSEAHERRVDSTFHQPLKCRHWKYFTTRSWTGTTHLRLENVNPTCQVQLDQRMFDNTASNSLKNTPTPRWVLPFRSGFSFGRKLLDGKITQFFIGSLIFHISGGEHVGHSHRDDTGRVLLNTILTRLWIETLSRGKQGHSVSCVRHQINPTVHIMIGCPVTEPINCDTKRPRFDPSKSFPSSPSTDSHLKYTHALRSTASVEYCVVSFPNTCEPKLTNICLNDRKRPPKF